LKSGLVVEDNLIAERNGNVRQLIMSYVTLEVEIDNGRIVPREPAKLPSKGKGLLTVLESVPETEAIEKMTPLEALHAVQKSLNLDEAKARAWMETVRDARR
jgi:hypothetical protein